MTAFRYLAARLRKAARRIVPSRGQDCIDLELPFVRVVVRRRLQPAVPAEVTVVIPRLEVRASRPLRQGTVETTEVILNSVTVVHSPRAPLAGAAGPAPGPKPPK